MTLNLKTLIAKLNDTSRVAATRAASICVSLNQFEVDLEHVFLALLEQERSDFVTITRRCGIPVDQLEADLRREIGRFKSGSTRTPVFSPHLPVLLEQAWLIASLSLPQPDLVRSGHLLLALLTEPSLAQLAQRGSPLFARFPVDELKHNLDKYARGSQEEWPAPQVPPASDGAADPVTQLQHQTPSLDRYTANLTQQARDGKLDPVVGRDSEIRQAMDILMRRRQNNPILTGEAGVGKTAVVEGLAQRIVAGDVPEALQGVAIHALDLGLLQAGAGVRGEFEARLNGVIDDVRKCPHPVVLFIDEAHTLIGAGGQAGQGDAANLLKPALARGELRTIAATTWGEYKRHVEKDAALARRFQVVKVEEPDEETACAMLRAMAPLMERHFGVVVRDAAVVAAVKLSQRYISGRQLPDKAVSLLDTACARVALARSTPPDSIERMQARMHHMAMEIRALGKDRELGAGGSGLDARLAALAAEQDGLRRACAANRTRWEQEKALGAAIALQREGEQPGAMALDALHGQLAELQGSEPLAPLDVDALAVAEVASAWTGIPLGRMATDEWRAVRALQETLQARILGQPHAMAAVAQRLKGSAAGLADPDKPRAVFLFAGPSGTGKTETALALAEALYGGERKVVTIHMNEYQEAHSVSGLKGSPPGYVGFGEGGVLTEAVRRNPYCVLLLDEFEKAHPDVAELFFQVFDKGVLDDAEGRTVDFRHAVIIATSNAGSGAIAQACAGLQGLDRPSPDDLEALARPALLQHFKAALLGRMHVVPFYPIADDVLERIIGMRLERVARRIHAVHAASFTWDTAVVALLLARCTQLDAGVRHIDRIIDGVLLPGLAEALLARMGDGASVSAIRIGVDGASQFTYSLV
ncbi:type VI secretion system ATPase TssH [Pseudoduganella ginsengisoli]|uniref:Type VI secretion system ATPase TssH n=1 Tax=Pseudoduganella ginsengisoli TaxID=1462440 RepID=A0A6L6PYB1_9BURK|nr:type VI secretion system ATPase TssH [Pseudoduganella ginsengisoli]MTW02111.1 type VI secretion system ATPase TssH [Pseudoduganella ginsengisoli]